MEDLNARAQDQARYALRIRHAHKESALKSGYHIARIRNLYALQLGNTIC